MFTVAGQADWRARFLWLWGSLTIALFNA